MKKIVSVILIFLLLFSWTGTAFAADAGLICSPWSRDYIRDAGEVYGILPESPAGGDYTEAITREDFCELAYETIAFIEGAAAYNTALEEADKNGGSLDLSSLPQKLYPTAGSKASPFSDTDNESVIFLADVGIILGKGSGIFAPGDLLTREEAATILERIASYFRFRKFENTLVFTDFHRVSDWAADGVNGVCGMGIMHGMGDGTFSPQSTFTREQSIATMIRVIGCIPHTLEELAGGVSSGFNFFWLWVEDRDHGVVLKLPMYSATYDYRSDYGYSSLQLYERDGKTWAAAVGSSNEPGSLSYQKSGTVFFDLSSGKERLFIPMSSGYFFALTKDHSAMILRDTRYSGPTVDAASDVYAVYDFAGRELIPPGSGWKALYDAGYVDTEHSVTYVWQ